MITQKQYETMILAGLQVTTQIEEVTGELSDEQRFDVAKRIFALIGEVLVRHGPKQGKHNQQLRSAYDRVQAIAQKEVDAANRAPGPQ